MNNIQEILSQINIQDLIKLFNIQIAIAIFLIFLIFRGLLSQLIVKIFFVLTRNKKKAKDSRLYRIMSVFLVFVGAYYAILILRPNAQFQAVVKTIFKIINIIFITSIVNSFITPESNWFKNAINSSKNDVVNNFICKIIRAVVWLISGYIILMELGYNLTSLVAAFGVGSVIISFAAQDTVKSLMSGIIIMTDKPFDLGDFIEVGNYKGTVQDMTFRSTRIKALDNTIITIPNSVITSEYVVNWNKLQNRRLEFTLNLSMDTTSEKIRIIVEKLRFILKNNPKVLSETVQVNLDAISNYSSDIKIFLYIDEANYRDFLNEKQRIYCDILELVEIENVDLAYPTQTVYVKNSEPAKNSLREVALEEMIGEEDEELAMKILAEQDNNKGDEQ